MTIIPLEVDIITVVLIVYIFESTIDEKVFNY